MSALATRCSVRPANNRYVTPNHERSHLLESLVLGIVQGTTEWLPVSSQGSVSAVASLIFDLSLADAVSFALWLHLGTAVSALIAFRGEIFDLARDNFRDPLHPSSLIRFGVMGTAVSMVIGVLVILTLDDLSAAVGAGAMLVVGVAMIGTAVVLRARPEGGTRTREDLSMADAVAFGLAQGFAAIPGLSRSGLTVSVLLGRRMDRGEALAVSFLMSIPASLGAALLSALGGVGIGFVEGLVGAAVSAIVGLVSIKTLLAAAQRVNFAAFVGVVGLAVIAGGIAQVAWF
jgi:undecaprenyl-diphosphatase